MFASLKPTITLPPFTASQDSLFVWPSTSADGSFTRTFWPADGVRGRTVRALGARCGRALTGFASSPAARR